MIRAVFDALIALVFGATIVFGGSEIYNIVRKESLTQVSKGLSPMHKYSRILGNGPSYFLDK